MPSFKSAISNSQCLIDVIVAKVDLGSNKIDIDLNNMFKALIDTGATQTCISKTIEERLNLIARSKARMVSASHDNVIVNEHFLSIGIPVVTGQRKIPNEHDKIEQQIECKIFDVKAKTLPIPNQEFDVLLGMDILMQCNIFMAHGEVVISF